MPEMILGVGLDLVEVGRLERSVSRQGTEILREFLSPAEIDSCRRSSRFLPACAAVFAVKEAFLKALGTGRSGRLTWLNIEVVWTPGSPPILTLSGAAEETARALGMNRAHVSFSGGVRQAAAFVVLERGAPAAAPDGLGGGARA